jgi:hypothetical protein
LATLLGAAALGLVILMALAANVARLGGVIAREVVRAQSDYLVSAGRSEAAQNNALRLGRCLRSEMLKSAQAGFVHPDTWAVAARVSAHPACMSSLRPLPAAEGGPRARRGVDQRNAALAKRVAHVKR